MWGLTIVGVCLILGLFTRLASLAGIGFILLFYLAAPPLDRLLLRDPSRRQLPDRQQEPHRSGALGRHLLTGSGRFAGVDRILSGLFRRKPRLATA
jgi:uncharacterized membrane protein YphA (DoxX/SURF4 family)